MLAHCVNPDCYAPLRSFAEGRLFQFEVVSISIAANDEMAAPFDEKPERQTAHFWLCGRCADRMTLVLEPMRGLKIVLVGAAAATEMTDVPLENLEFGQSNNC